MNSRSPWSTTPNWNTPPRTQRRRVLLRSRKLPHCAVNSRPLDWSSMICTGHVRYRTHQRRVRTSQHAHSTCPQPQIPPRPRHPTKLRFYASGRSSRTAPPFDDRGASGIHYLDDHVRGAPTRDNLASRLAGRQPALKSRGFNGRRTE